MGLVGDNSAVTQRGFLTGARLKISRLRLDAGLPKLYQQLTSISSHALDVARVGVWFFDSEKQQVRCEGLYARDGAAAPPPLAMERLKNYVDAVREKRFVATTDARVDPYTSELSDYLQTWNITSLLDSAVYRNGEVVGVVCHEHVGPPREWRSEERQFAATVADLLSHFIEVDERIHAEQQLHELELKLKDAHRLDALGRMAAGIAHDLNNLLTVITNGIELLRRGPDPETLTDMEESARHAATLVSQLMSLGKRQTPVALVQAVAPLIANLEAVLSPRKPAGVRLVIDAEKNLMVWADGAQLIQVLSNLLTNAFQAMGETGVAVLRAHARGGGVTFEVIDTGPGIKEDLLPKLFDPFFTSKRDGYGIGLAIVQQLVALHGGEVSVSSTVGDGSTFRVWWPSAPL
jgi:two-component system cell cycle sensor histidine kinase/response regulator CckA